jgi:hypothetical protein
LKIRFGSTIYPFRIDEGSVMAGERHFAMGKRHRGSGAVLSQRVAVFTVTPIWGIQPIDHTRPPVFFLYLTGAAPPGALKAASALFVRR